MTRLSDTQLVILGAAAQRANLSALPLPDSLKLKGGAFAKVMGSLRNRGLIRVLDTDGGPEREVITSQGMAAIDVETEGDEAPASARSARQSRRRPRPLPRARARRRPPSPTGRPRRPPATPKGRPVSRPPSPPRAPAPSRRL
jgi:hypothetical protein